MNYLNEYFKKYYFLNNYKPLSKHFGYIYIYYNPTYGIDEPYFKIGITINVKTRISNLNNGQRERGLYCYISNIVHNYNLADTILKKMLENYSHNNEVYNIDFNKAISIIENIVYDVNYHNLFILNNKYKFLQNTPYFLDNTFNYEYITVSN
jgi:hypothetical protein